MFSRNHSEEIYYFSKKQLFKRFGIRRKASPIYLKSCTFFGATLIDRTGTLDAGLDYAILDEIPSFNGFQASFREVCMARAKQILDATDASFKLLWSGGIDSTVALVALLPELEQSGQLDRLTVLLSDESVAEYPTFFHEVIKGRLNYQRIETTIYESIAPEDVIITGEHGDQLFGSDKLKYPILTGDAFSPYEEILDFIISRKLGTDKYTLAIIDYLQPLIDASPVKVNTLYDYLWWMNFALKWQTVSMRLIGGLDRQPSDIEKTVFHFFKAADFQRWSMANHDKKIKQTWNSYKYIAKEMIFDFHQDRDYLLNKEKEQSLKEVIVGSEEAGFLKRSIAGLSGRLKFV